MLLMQESQKLQDRKGERKSVAGVEVEDLEKFDYSRLLLKLKYTQREVEFVLEGAWSWF